MSTAALLTMEPKMANADKERKKEFGDVRKPKLKLKQLKRRQTGS